MLGSLSETEDAVQEAWLRLSGSEPSGTDNLGGWLTTVVARVCLNMLRSRKSRREEPLGVHVPDPVVSHADGVDPEHEALLADSVGLGLLVVLDPDVVLRSDGGLARPGASAVVHGGPAVAEQALTFGRLSRSYDRHSSTQPRESSWRRADARSRSWASQSPTARSSRSTCSPTPCALHRLDLAAWAD
jgi:hypothetical protein